MIGIYAFINKTNNKIYIGQSKDCHRRYMEHRRSAYPEKYASKNIRDINTPIHLAFQKYGFENFDYKILEECSVENLDEREKYWINYYNSTNKLNGYNISDGGQDHINIGGEYHSQAKLTQQEVNKIKDLLKTTNMSLTDIQKLFPIVGKSMICLINTGKNWNDPTESYPLRKSFSQPSGENSSIALFTDAEVLKMRTLYANGLSSKEICEKYSEYSPNTIKAILYGRSYKNLPYWHKNTNKWIEPCIDYPQSLKQAGEQGY